MAKSSGLKAAIQAKEESAIKATVDTAVKIYKDALTAAIENETGVTAQAKPGEAQVNTVFGDVPFNLVFDDATKWQVITQAYVDVTNAVSALPKDADVKVETAKLIAENAVLRSVGQTATTDTSGLL